MRSYAKAAQLSPASTLLAPRPSLHQSHSSPAISRGIEPTPSPPVPQVELLSQTLNASADATPPISPAGSRRSRGSRSANILRKRAKSMTGKKMSPKIQSSSERPRSVLGTSNVRVGSSSTLVSMPTSPQVVRELIHNRESANQLRLGASPPSARLPNRDRPAVRAPSPLPPLVLEREASVPREGASSRPSFRYSTRHQGIVPLKRPSASRQMRISPSNLRSLKSSLVSTGRL